MENVRPLERHTADDDALNRNVPHDPDAEAYICGIILHSAQAYTDCAQIISREDIYLPRHRLIWDVVGGMVAAGTALHPVTVRAEIGRLKRLREVADGAYVDHLGTQTITAAMAPSFAEQVAEAARLRRHQDHALRIRAAIARGDTATELDDLQQAFVRAEEKRATTGHGPSHLTDALLDWDPFFATDFGAVELLPGKLMAPGEQIAIVGDGKAGKSLFTQEWTWRMATGQTFLGDKPQDPVPVLYIDAENGRDQIQARFASFGAGPGRMGMLSYASFPVLRPLDTPGGGADLLALAQAVEARLVVIDTISRFISGEENSSDPWLALYRNTLLPLKREGIGSARLDHLGKDSTRGARGNSAKSQDVDQVWELSAQGGGTLALRRTHTRTGIGPDDFVIVRQAQRDGDGWRPGGTRHVLMTFETEPGTSGMATIPGTVEHTIAALDRAGIPNDASNRTVRLKLAELRVPAGNERIAEVVRIRKARTGPAPSGRSAERSADLENDRSRNAFPEHPGNTENPSSDGSRNTPGTPRNAPVPPVPPSQEGDGGGTPAAQATEDPLCTVCDRPLDPDWAARGHDTHVGCDPRTGTFLPDDYDTQED